MESGELEQEEAEKEGGDSSDDALHDADRTWASFDDIQGTTSLILVGQFCGNESLLMLKECLIRGSNILSVLHEE